MNTDSVRDMLNKVDGLLADFRKEHDKKHARHDFHRKSRVVELAIRRGGFVTVSDVARKERCSRQIARATLASLCRAGVFERVFRGIYTLSRAEQIQT